MLDNPHLYITLFGGLNRYNRCMGSYEQWVGPAPCEDYWIDRVKGPYVIVNTFNLCVVILSKRRSTVFLPTYSEKVQTDGRL